MTVTIEKHTVAMHFVTSAVAHLSPEAKERALSAAGIPAPLLELAHARVPATAFSALWLSVARELDDEFFGLDGRSMKVGSFALICQAVLSSADLERGLKRMLRGFALFLDDVNAELHLEGAEAVIQINNRITREADRRFADETLMVLLHGLMCWFAGRRIPLTRVNFAHSRPAHASEYSLMFCSNVAFDAQQSTMCFESRALAAPAAQNAVTLQQFLRTAPQSVFLKYRNEESRSAQVRRRLRDSVRDADGWPTLDGLATELGTTPATLRRRLDREGASYQAIKDQLRSDVAIDYLCNSSLSVDEIAAHVGFQDASAFHRAFKRWTGVQPGEYRRQKLSSDH